MNRLSSFISGVRVDQSYSHFSKANQKKNKRCISCEEDFIASSKVHLLACGHFCHAKCGNRMFNEAAQAMFSGSDAVKMTCSDRCGQEIQFHAENLKRGWVLREKLLSLSNQEMLQYLQSMSDEEVQFLQEFGEIFIEGAINNFKRKTRAIELETIRTGKSTLNSLVQGISFVFGCITAAYLANGLFPTPQR